MDREILNRVLDMGRADWLMIGDISSQFGAGLTDEETLQRTLGVVRVVLESGWMEMGDLTPDFESRGWAPGRALVWIEQSWRRLKGPERDTMCWFANTRTGNEMAGQV